MNPYAHLHTHATRAAELQAEARAWALSRHEHRLRTRFGWLLVETGLRLVHPPAAPRLART
jgi:hypothetical protein